MNYYETHESVLKEDLPNIDLFLFKNLSENDNMIKRNLTRKIMRIENEACYNYQYTLLHASARFGRIDLIRKFCLTEATIDYRDELKRTPLWYAAAYNHYATAKELIKYSAKVRLKDISGWSPLHVAAINGFYEMCEILLNNGADPMETDNLGFCPLAKAVWSRNYRIINMFIQWAPASVRNPSFNDKIFPLHLATLKNEVKICEILLRNGAEVDCKNKEGITCLMLAAQLNLDKLCAFFLKMNANPEFSSKMGWTPLHMAAHGGCAICVQCLLSHTQTDFQNITNGWTALHVAANCGHLEVVEYLLNSKIVNSNATTFNGLTAIDLAAKNGHFLVLLKLIENIKNIYHGPALHLAAISGHKQCVLILIRFGIINVNTLWRPEKENLSKLKYSPIQYAIFSGQKEIAYLLLVHGAKFLDAIKAYIMIIIHKEKYQWLKHILKSLKLCHSTM